MASPEKTLAQKIAEAEAAHAAALEAYRLEHPEEAEAAKPEYEGPWTIQMVVVGAKDIIAADRGGTSDPFAIIELQDSTDKKPVMAGQKKFYVKTKTIRKTLTPVWDEVITWENKGHDGQTAYQRIRGKPFHTKLVCLGETVRYKLRSKEPLTSHADGRRFHLGIFLGIDRRTGSTSCAALRV